VSRTTTAVAGGPARLDAAVAAAFGVARAEGQRAIAEGRVRVNGERRAKSFRLAGGETLQIDLRDPADLPAEPGPLAIRFEDDWLMVVSKPSGLPTHPTATRRSGTLVNRLLALGVPLSRAGGEYRPGIVHRLDAGTSGLMVVTKDDGTHRDLAAMFRRHDVDRRYLALTRGRMEHDRLLVEAPLERRGAKVVARATSGRDSATEVSIREALGKATLVEARPRTGRTHQIRVHLSSIGHPILGDSKYGGAGADAVALALTRPFLHSWWIGFDHPETGDRIERDDPLPPDLAEALRRARAD
jgi:23S rRNA pseudouridine1911/1915/1917 synthase